MPTTPRNSDGDHDHEIRVIRFHAAMVPPPSGFRVNIFLPAVTVLPVGARARLRTKKKIRRGMKKIVIIKKKNQKLYNTFFLHVCLFSRPKKKKGQPGQKDGCSMDSFLHCTRFQHSRPLCCTKISSLAWPRRLYSWDNSLAEIWPWFCVV